MITVVFFGDEKLSDVLKDKGYFVEAKPDYQNDMIILHVSKEM